RVAPVRARRLGDWAIFAGQLPRSQRRESSTLVAKERRVLAVAGSLELGDRDETKRRRVDAIAKARGARAIFEDVPEVRVAVERTDLDARDAMRLVGFLDDSRVVDRPRE